MDVIIGFYLLFAITTATVALFELYYPVMAIIRETNPDNPVSVNFKMMLFVFWVITLLVAPFVFPSCVVPKLGERFRSSIYESLIEL